MERLAPTNVFFSLYEIMINIFVFLIVTKSHLFSKKIIALNFNDDAFVNLDGAVVNLDLRPIIS